MAVEQRKFERTGDTDCQGGRMRESHAMMAPNASFVASKSVGVRGRRGLRGLCTEQRQCDSEPDQDAAGTRGRTITTRGLVRLCCRPP